MGMRQVLPHASKALPELSRNITLGIKKTDTM
jgi:hypothetical protein